MDLIRGLHTKGRLLASAKYIGLISNKFTITYFTMVLVTVVNISIAYDPVKKYLVKKLFWSFPRNPEPYFIKKFTCVT